MKNIDLSCFEGKKAAFVCSGGVVKSAAWHNGVLLALEDLGFKFVSNKNPPSKEPNKLEISTYVGTSAGSVMCIYLATGYTPTEIMNATFGKQSAKFRGLKYSDMFSFKKIMKTSTKRAKVDINSNNPFPIYIKKLISPFTRISGLFTTAGMVKYLKDEILENYEFDEFEADLFIVGTQLDHSRKVIFGKYNYPNPRHDSTAVYYTDVNVYDAACASMSVPPFYAPYPIKNKITGQIDYYIDGEIRETLSNHVAVDNGCETIISSWTHTPFHYHDEIGSLVNYGLPAICMQAIYLIIQKKIVTSRAKRTSGTEIINTVNEYMKSENFTERQRKELVNILERKLQYKKGLKFIDVCPKSEDVHLFFSNAFSLDNETCTKTSTHAYKRTLEVFRNREWENY